MLWVGKVGLKDGLKWPSSATGPSPLGSMGPRAGQVKTRTNYQSWSVCSALHGAKSTPTTCPPNKTPTTHNNNVKLSLLRPTTKQSPPWASSSAMAPPSSTGAAPVSSYGASPKGAKGSPSGAGSIASPHITRSPTSSIWTSLGRMPNSRALPDARSCLHARNASPSQLSFAVASVFTAAWAA